MSVLKSNDFELKLLDDDEVVHTEAKDGYAVAELPDGTEYTLQVCNLNQQRRATAIVDIEGGEVLRLQLLPGQTVKLDRGSRERNTFKFVHVDSQEGKDGALDKNSKTLGEIRVVFKLEAAPVYAPRYDLCTGPYLPYSPVGVFGFQQSMPQPCSMQPLGFGGSVPAAPVGGTVLSSNRSSLKFTEVAAIANFDDSKTLSIVLKLLLLPKRARPLHPLATISSVEHMSK